MKQVKENITNISKKKEKEKFNEDLNQAIFA